MWSSAVQEEEGKKQLFYYSLSSSQDIVSVQFVPSLFPVNTYANRWLNKCTLNFRTLRVCVSCGMKLVNWTGIAEEQQS